MSNISATLEWLAAQWILRFSEITLTMGDLQLEMHVRHLDGGAVNSDLLWWEQPFSCAPESPVWVGAPENSWSEIGNIVLTAAGVDPAPESEIQSTYFEIVRQSMGSLGNDIGNRISMQVTPNKGTEEGPGTANQHAFEIEAKLPDKTILFFLVITDDLCSVISSSATATGGGQPEHTSLQHAEHHAEPAGPIGSRTFELLLDVELPISVSFGRAALKLQDAIKLITGSLIELDRGLNDPVDLIVNNCVIARGEVVVVDGNYGVRITEIISQRERLQQTRRYMLQ